MELTELHKEWIADLRRYPERQGKNYLALRDNKDNIIQACCLGQLLLTAERLGLHTCIWDNTRLVSDRENNCTSLNRYKTFGLVNTIGGFKLPMQVCNPIRVVYNSLADANDAGVSWLEIADFIEQNPDKVFVE
jgi:hypothetical protein